MLASSLTLAMIPSIVARNIQIFCIISATSRDTETSFSTFRGLKTKLRIPVNQGRWTLKLSEVMDKIVDGFWEACGYQGFALFLCVLFECNSNLMCLYVACFIIYLGLLYTSF